MTRVQYIYHSTCITVHSTYSTNSKVLNPVHDLSTVHILLYGNIQFRVHFVLVFAQPSDGPLSRKQFQNQLFYINF
jgi:hypothetical protein